MVIIQTNVEYQISGFTGDPILQERLTEMGFRTEKKIQVQQQLPLNGPIIVMLENARFSLRPEEFKCLQLKLNP